MASLRDHPVMIDGRYISDRYPGIGRYVHHLVAALARASPTLPIMLLTGSDGPQTRFDLGELEGRGVELIPLRAPLRTLGGRREVRRAWRTRAPSLFHAPHVLSALPNRCRSVVTIHDLIPIQTSGRGLSARLPTGPAPRDGGALRRSSALGGGGGAQSRMLARRS